MRANYQGANSAPPLNSPENAAPLARAKEFGPKKYFESSHSLRPVGGQTWESAPAAQLTPIDARNDEIEGDIIPMLGTITLSDNSQGLGTTIALSRRWSLSNGQPANS